jgi:hypothetical protein
MNFNYGSMDPLAGLDLPEAASDYSYIARKTDVEQVVYVLGEEDPKDVLLKKLGNALDSFSSLNGPRVLVATAPTPVKKSSILQTQTARDKAIQEGRWQGKAALVLKVGGSAFEYDPRYPSYPWEEDKHGRKPKVGDWVYFRTSDAWETGIRVSESVAISARVIWDADIIGIIDDVERIF